MTYDYATIFNNIVTTDMLEETSKEEKDRILYFCSDNPNINGYITNMKIKTEDDIEKNKTRLKEISPKVDRFHANYDQLCEVMGECQKEKIEEKIRELEIEIENRVQNPPKFMGGNIVVYLDKNNLTEEVDIEYRLDKNFVTFPLKTLLEQKACKKILESIKQL